MRNTGLTILVALGLSACGGETRPMVRDIAEIPPSPTHEIFDDDTTDLDILPRQEIRLGLLLPLSGPDSIIGKALFNAATLALFDSRDKRLTLMPYDTKGTAEGAAEAMTQLLTHEPDLIIGPLFSHSIMAIKQMAQEAGVNVIGFSSDHTVAGDGVFLMNFRMEEQIERVIHYASTQGYARFATLVPETAYGMRALEIFGASVAEQKRELTSVEFYPPDSSKLVDPVKNIAHYKERRKRYTREIDFLERLGEEDDFAQEMLDELKNEETIGDVEFDAILLPEGGAMLTTLAAWVSYYEIDPAKVKILGTGLWDDPMLFLEPQLHGGWFAAPDHKTSGAFLNRYKDIYGESSPRITTLAYDTVALAATLVRQAKNPNFSAEKITDTNGFSGIEGLFRFAPSGLIERGLAVYEVSDKAFTVIDPAPTSFINRDKIKNEIEEGIEAEIQNSIEDERKSATLTPPEPSPSELSSSESSLEFEQEDHSEAASLLPLPLSDGRPFPYNPVQEDAVNNYDQ
ncbi:MAG: penicillin-binding protein activator [Emcibacter sp.]|nr:penicillin-binding protein activator [Emcibacter sp.]